MSEDTISRQAAVYAVDEISYAFNVKTNAHWALIKALADLPSAERHEKWIPVTERLPEKDGQYLVSGKWANKDGEVWICEFVRLCHIGDGQYLRGWCNEASRPAIKAWMPLPDPYKGGEQNG